MPETADYEKNPEMRAEQIPIEWQILDSQRNNLGNILRGVFNTRGRVWGAITKEKVVLGDKTLMASPPYKDFAAYPIEGLPSEKRNETRHQIYAAPVSDPTTISEIFNANLTHKQEEKILRIIFGRVEKLIDGILDE